MISPKTWFVTGTSSGLGRRLSEFVLQRGDRVAATLRDPHMLDDLKAEYGDRLWIERLDVIDALRVQDVVRRAFERFGRIDVIVSNAAYGLFGAAEEVSDAQIRRQIDTNLIGSINVIRAALPYLRSQGAGRILQVSSEGGQIAYPNFSLYHATKWGIEGFVESVSQEVAPFNITFTIVEPGATRTKFGAGLEIAQPLDAYAQTPSGDIRRAIVNNLFAINGDAEKTIRAMIDVVDVTPAPRRLVLGSDAFKNIQLALTARLSELQAQKSVALSVNVD